MKITINRINEETQTPIIEIDTSTCYYPLAIRESLMLALRLDGYDESTIEEVFGVYQDCKKEVINDTNDSTRRNMI